MSDTLSFKPIVKHLPASLRAAGFAAATPTHAKTIDDLLRGRARTVDLPAAVAVALIEVLTTDVRTTALEGETRVTVLDAAGQHSAASKPASDVPPVFRGDLHQVIDKLRARTRNLAVADIKAGLAAHDPGDRAQLLGATMRLLHRDNRTDVIVEAAAGELCVDVDVVCDIAVSQQSYMQCAKLVENLVADERIDMGAFVRVMKALCGMRGVHVHTGSLSPAHTAALHTAARSWGDTARWGCAGVLWSNRGSVAEFIGVGHDAPENLVLDWVTATDDFGAAARNWLTPDMFKRTSPYQAARVVRAQRSTLSPELFAAALARLGDTQQLIALGATENPVSYDTARYALEQLTDDKVAELYVAATKAVRDHGGRKNRSVVKSGWGDENIKTLSSPGAVALFDWAVSNGYGWKFIWEAAEYHPAAGQAIANRIGAVSERLASEGVAVGARTFALVAEMASTFSGELDELIETCATVADGDT